MTEKDKATRTASSHQEGGDHYAKMQQDMQPWNVLSHWLTPEEYRGYQKGVAIAYLAREGSKGGDMDVRKAIHHLQRLVEEFPAQQLAFPPIIEPEVNADKAEDRHAELRKTYREGQRWQYRVPGEAWHADDEVWREPAWRQHLQYRRHPDCTWKEPELPGGGKGDVTIKKMESFSMTIPKGGSGGGAGGNHAPEAEDPHAEMRKIYKPGMRWRYGAGGDWSSWTAGTPLWNAERDYEIHPDDMPKPAEKPWYPDDSGEWVEVPDDLMEMPKELSGHDEIEALMLWEREDGDWSTQCANAMDWDWDQPSHDSDRIVAYKVVKP